MNFQCVKNERITFSVIIPLSKVKEGHYVTNVQLVQLSIDCWQLTVGASRSLNPMIELSDNHEEQQGITAGLYGVFIPPYRQCLTGSLKESGHRWKKLYNQ